MLLSCINCLYILEIKSLSVASFAMFFSCSVSCFSFFFLWFPLLCPVSLFLFFCFYFYYSRKWIQKAFLPFISKSLLPVFSFNSLVVSRLTFRSLIHVWFIFMYDIGEFSNFILSHVVF